MDNTYITVLTPTYNRANLLPRLYQSLQRQTYKHFEWIVVDDGSKDNTQELVTLMARTQNDFVVRYIKKENGGKHTAINLGVNNAMGELLFIADSDDALPQNALELILKEWKNVENYEHIAGVVGLDCNMNTGKAIGSEFPKEAIVTNMMDIRYKYHVTGDMKEVFRTNVLKEFPFPEIKGERFCPEQLCWFRIAQKYNFRFFNKYIYAVEYQNDGISANIIKSRMNSPILAMMTYTEQNSYNIPLKIKFKSAINYWRFRFCLDEGKKRKDIPKLASRWNFVLPLGWLMHIYDKTNIK